MTPIQYVITGTDTDVGKTIFAAALVGALKAHYWKPIQAGIDDGSDTDIVKKLCGQPHSNILSEAYCLNTPCSPHLAAKIDDVTIDIDILAPPPTKPPLIIEGAGGVLVPINHQTTYIDIFARWQIPIIIIARTCLGTINHSLLTIEALKSRNIPIHGIAFIGDEVIDSQNIICEMTNIKPLGRLPFLDILNAENLQNAFHKHFNIKDFIQ